MNNGKNHMMSLIPRPELVMSHGQGSWLYDEQERQYLDCVQGWAVNVLGHAPAELLATINQQASQLITASPAYFTRPLLSASEQVCAATAMDSVFFTNSGAEANDAAIKLARKWAQKHRPGAFRILTTKNSFHGRTLACVAASGKAGWEAAFPPMLSGFEHIAFGDAERLESAITPDVCAIMLEPIQGEAGIVVPPEGYLSRCREITERFGVLLILDEIQTGVGRTGTFLRCSAESITPDILTLGKGLAGGLPVGALLAKGDAAAFERGDHGGTFTGNPLTTACIVTVLNIVNNADFLGEVQRKGAYLQEKLSGLAMQTQLGLSDFRGAGLLRAFTLNAPLAEAVRDRALELGLLINAPKPDVLRILPQLRVSLEEIDLLSERLLLALQHVAAARNEPRVALD